MNKKLLVGMFSTFMVLAPWSGYAAQTIDAPHRTVDSTNLATEDDCTSCHFTNYDVTLPEGACERCHRTNTPPYGDSVAPVVVTHKNLKCQACHNPHVSLQASGIAGAFTGVTYDAVNNKTTLTGVSPTPDASWAAKTGAERGMILWVTDGADKLSYEVKAIDAAANTVTVSGNVTASPGAFDLRRGQLIAKKVSKTEGNSYRQGDLTVQFPSSGSPSIFIDTVNATPTGVCQVCHTTTAHWTSNGNGITHNANRVCTECHTHDTGFLVTACNACHQGVGLDGVPVDAPGLAQPPTGSVTAGQHQIHAVDYAMPCTTCHTGTGMDRLNNPTNPVTDDKIQIGFSTTKYPQGYLTTYDGQSGVTYEGTNHTTVTNNGTLSCGTVYCHSNGHSVRMNCGTAITNSSLKWDGSSPDPQGDTVKCNNCHGFKTGTGLLNPMISARHIGPHSGYDCYYCHANTVDATNAISAGGRANHANGVYNVTAGGGLTFTYDPTTKKCSVGGCHGVYTTAWNGPSTTYPSGYTDPETCPNACTGDATLNADPVAVSFNAEQISSNTIRYTSVVTDADNNDPVKAVCRGGGHNGASGRLRIQRASGGKFANLVKFDGTPVVYDWVLSDAATQVNTTNFPQPVVYFHRIFMDNDPETGWNLDPGKVYKIPALAPNDGLIYGATDGIAWTAAFQYISWNPSFDDSHVNVLAVPKVTPVVTNLGGGSYKLTLQSGIVDPDAIDLVKNDYFGGHGHDGTVKVRVKAYWGGSTVNSVHKALPTDNTTPLTAWDKPIEYTFTNKVSGSQLWYFVSVFDSHREDPTANAASPTGIGESGWAFVLAP